MDAKSLAYAAAAVVILGPFALGLPHAYHELTRPHAASPAAAANADRLSLAQAQPMRTPVRHGEP